MRVIIITIFLSVKFCYCYSQKYKPDFYGYVADKKFQTEIKLRNYKLVSAFDTLDDKIPIVYATVLKGDSIKWIDLNLNEYKYEYDYNYEYDLLDNLTNQLGVFFKVKKTINGLDKWCIPDTRIKVKEDTLDVINFDKKSVYYNNCIRNYLYYSCEKRYGLIDSLGKVILRAKYNINPIKSVDGNFNFLALYDSINHAKIYNIRRQKISNNKYNKIQFPYAENLFIAENGSTETNNYILIDTNFNELTSDKFIQYYDYSQQGIIILKKKDSINNYSVYNSNGELISANLIKIGPYHDASTDNKDFTICKKINDSFFSLINLRYPNKIIPFNEYNSLQYLPKNKVVKTIAKISDKYFVGLCDTNKTILLDAKYDEINAITIKKFILRKNSDYFLFNKTTETIDKINYIVTNPASEINILSIVKNEADQNGAVDENNKLVIPFGSSKYYKVYKYLYNDNGIIDQKGNLVLSFPNNPFNRSNRYFKNRTMNGVFEKSMDLLIDRYNNELRINSKIECKF